MSEARFAWLVVMLLLMQNAVGAYRSSFQPRGGQRTRIPRTIRALLRVQPGSE